MCCCAVEHLCNFLFGIAGTKLALSPETAKSFGKKISFSSLDHLASGTVKGLAIDAGDTVIATVELLLVARGEMLGARRHSRHLWRQRDGPFAGGLSDK